MGDPLDFRPAPGTIPTSPGVYRFRDGRNQVIYVGKAKNLRNRLNSYFVTPENIRPLSRQMLKQAASVDWTVVRTEGEALQLEWTWIQQYEPRFNVQFRDDKSYPLLALSTAEQFPRMWVYRGKRQKNVRYFGPYSKVGALRETVDLLAKVFPIRTCTNGVMRRHTALGRPCLLGYIDKCSAPCVDLISEEDYAHLVHQCISFLAGNDQEIAHEISLHMQEASANLDFEKAARLRDQLDALAAVLEKQTVVLEETMDADVVGIYTDEIEASVQLFKVRGGRIKGQQGWVVSKTGETDLGEWTEGTPDPALPFVVESFLLQYYDTHPQEVPPLVLVPALPPHVPELEQQLSGLRGFNVEIRRPQRGNKRQLLETVTLNAQEALRQHKLKRSSDLTARSAALEELQKYLGLDEPPLRIECTDISHLQGTDVVASLVVFEDGLPKKSDYRTYIIKEAAGDGHSNDVASIAEVTQRRFRNFKDNPRTVPADAASLPETSSTAATADIPQRFSYPPNLFVVDGGLPQVNAAAAVLEELGITSISIIGLAKRLEEVWIPHMDYPLILPRDSEALYLLQRVRDESHRTAIGFHRRRRSKSMLESELDKIPGVGHKRQQALRKHFSSLKKLKAATVEEIAEVEGFGDVSAQKLFDALHP